MCLCVVTHIAHSFVVYYSHAGVRTNDSCENELSKSKMGDNEFRNLLDCEGRLSQPIEFRMSVYRGGFDPCLRTVGWRHLLNIFPKGLILHHFLYIKSMKFIDFFSTQI